MVWSCGNDARMANTVLPNYLLHWIPNHEKRCRGKPRENWLSLVSTSLSMGITCLYISLYGHHVSLVSTSPSMGITCLYISLYGHHVSLHLLIWASRALEDVSPGHVSRGQGDVTRKDGVEQRCQHQVHEYQHNLKQRGL